MLPILSVEKLHVRFPDAEQDALAEISFQLFPGQTIALVGESGSGKSITSLAVMGLLPTNAIRAGSIFYRKSLTAKEPTLLEPNGMQEIRGKEISMIFQEPMSALNPVMRVGKQLRECFNSSMSKAAQLEKEIYWWKKVQLPNPENIGQRYPHQLSGGQKQRVMIAMAMSNNPKILIADEPTTALDAAVQQEVLDLMKKLQEEMGTAMIFITHDLSVAQQMADEVIVMRNGMVLEQGTAKTIFHAATHPYTKALLQTKPSPKWKGYKLPVVNDFLEGNDKTFSPEKLDANAVITDTEPLLQVKNLTVQYPLKKNWLGNTLAWFHAVDEVSLNIFPQETVGLVGESGCGKSTLGKCLVGLVNPNSGSIIYNGKALHTNGPKHQHDKTFPIQMVFQDAFASLNPRLTIAHTLSEPLVVHTELSRTAVRKKVLELLNVTGLSKNSLEKYPHEFSGGQRQRLGIARALAMNPRLLICDESVSALDVSVQAQILNLLNDLKQELKLSYLFISHDPNVVSYFCDRILHMAAGKMVDAPEPLILKKELG